MSSLSPPQRQGREEKERWMGAWKEPEKPRFDAGRSSPALSLLLREAVDGGGGSFDAGGTAAVADALGAGARVLVPGCGRGYDLATLAAAAARIAEEKRLTSSSAAREPRGGKAVVVGWDYVPEAVRSAREWLSTRRDEIPSSVEVKVEEADFFERARDADASSPSSSSPPPFTLAYDYTFFCALPPASRPAWALAYASLLREPGSTLVTQVFPSVPAPGRDVEKLPPDEREAFAEAFRNGEPETTETSAALRAAEGPPWPVSPRCYEEVLVPAGFDLVSCDAVPAPLSHRGRGGREFLAVWRRRREGSGERKGEKLSAL